MNEIAGYTDPYPDLKGTDRVVEPCRRCGGSGIYDAPTSISWNGRGKGSEPLCLLCGGSGKQSRLVSSARAAARAEVKARLNAQAAEERAVAARIEWVAAGYDVLLQRADDSLDLLRHGDPLRRTLEYAREGINLFSATAEDAAAVTAALTAIDDRTANAVPVPEGRVKVEGTIVSWKWKDGENGFADTIKILVECDGWKVYGNLPKALWPGNYFDATGTYQHIDGAQKGDRISFTATLSRSADDQAFGYFSRPTKAVQL